MTILFEDLHAAGWICRKDEKIEKVTASQDDDSVWELAYSWLDLQEHEKI
jgi:hypothetical protein